jgi:hypothetical protein
VRAGGRGRSAQTARLLGGPPRETGDDRRQLEGADWLRTLSAGYSMHVPKPVDPAELGIVVASLAGRG